MKPCFLVYKKLPANAMAIFPFIILKEKRLQSDFVLVNHEKIHFRQQLELLIIPFYVLYLLNYLINLMKYKNHDQAYFHIVFEKEAYACDQNLEYLKQRRFFSWAKYL